MADYLPSSDADYSAWLQNFLTAANANLANLGLVAADVTALENAASIFDTNRGANDTAQAAAQAATAQKDAARASAEELTRTLVGRIQAHPGVTDAHRSSLGITVRSSARTAVGAPTSRPVGTIDTSQRLQHTVSFVDELTPNTRAKPDGANGCEIWVKVDGPPPTDPSELRYLATDTRSPYVAAYDGTQAGKIAHYMLRWVSTRGDVGPWSQTMSATITN